MITIKIDLKAVAVTIISMLAFIAWIWVMA